MNNKLDSISRMTDKMKEIVDFETSQSQQFSNNDSLDPYDREGYIETRKYWNEDSPSVYKVIDDKIDGPNGHIPIRLFYPSDKRNLNCIVFIHGGGFVVGNLDTHDGIMRRLSLSTGAVVVGIDYSLAPEYKFPIPIYECEELVEYLHRDGDKYGIDKNHISLSGDSGGAYLSLATALHMRDTRDSISYLKSLLLYYGAYGLKDSMSIRLYGGYWDGLTRENLDEYNRAFTREEDDEDPYRVLFNSDLSYGLPPTYITVGELDPLLDDSKLLYEILRENSIPVELKIYPGIIHAFLHYSKKLPEARKAIEDSARFYKKV